jgi:hypothetical protein
MKTTLYPLLARMVMAVVLLAAASWGRASTVWNGTNTAVYHTQENSLQDQLAADVKLTRGSSGGLYNSAMESSAVSGTSPKGTAWAVGTLANFSTLTYGPCPLEAGNHPPGYASPPTTFVVHLTSASDDIYLQLTLTNWGGEGGSGDKTFGYIRSTAAVVAAPAVSITNPVSGAVFAAPANVSIGATASVSGGSVTNVQFFTNGVSLKSVTIAPFTAIASNLVAGAYALKAVATAGGISATSATVNVSVINPAPATVSAATLSAGRLSFSYSGSSGLSYVVQSSSNLLNWLPVVTNLASGSPVPFSNPATNRSQFYRIGLLPNP